MVLLVLVSREEIRNHILSLLQRNEYSPIPMAVPEELVQSLRGRNEAIVFLDVETLRIHGASLYSKLKAACAGCKIILLCDQAKRDMIRPAMEQGAYGGILEPYAEWEVLTMVRHILADKHPAKRRSGRKSLVKSPHGPARST